MLHRISTGKISLDNDWKAKLVTEEVIGDIEKVVIKYDKDCSPESNVQIITSDGETIVNYSGNKDCILYPRNWNLVAQKYMGVNIVSSEGSALSADKYVSLGKLIILVMGKKRDDIINDIQIVIRGVTKKSVNVKKVKEIKKFTQEVIKDAPVTSATSGVYNPAYSRRRKEIEEYANKVLQKVMIEEEVTLDIQKQKDGLPDLSEFIHESLYGRKFEGLPKSTSDAIKEYIVRGLAKGFPMHRIIEYINRKGGKVMDPARAEIIARTESQAIQNAMREWSYKKTDPNEENLYKWLGPNDSRTTQICKNIKSRTVRGVSLSILRKIINSEVDKAIARGELPQGYSAREFTPHFSCRHSFVRAF